MSTPPDNAISENLRRLRKNKNYSLEKISKLTDLSLNTVAKIESGINSNPTYETLQKLALALGVEVNDLIK
ncbi:MAG: helix-turn-helix transcriptional regulator [Bacteroidales bacterium]